MARTGQGLDKNIPHARLLDDAMTRIDPAEEAGRLYDRFADGLYRYALMILADPEGAADAIQQVFAAVVARRTRIDCGERYLRRAVRNQCCSQLRERSRRAPLADAPMLEAVAAGADPTERIAIERAIRVLPAEQREVLHMKVFEGMTFQEIADAIDESINTVASRYRYAIEKLRAHLATAEER